MGKLVTEKLRDSEVLEVRVLDPARADPFVRQILDVLEEKQPHHEARWGAGAAMPAKQRGEFIIDPVPIDLPSQAHQLVLHVDNLVEPQAEQVARTGHLLLIGLHRIPPSDAARESQFAVFENPKP